MPLSRCMGRIGNLSVRRVHGSTVVLSRMSQTSSPSFSSRRTTGIGITSVGNTFRRKFGTLAEKDETPLRVSPRSVKVAPRVVLVTGAAAGIGRAVAQRFAAAGDRIAIHYNKSEEAAEATKFSLLPSELGEHVVVQSSLEEPGAASKLVENVIEKCGHVDVLVCNHGIYEETPVEETSPAQWTQSFERVLCVNLVAPAELAFGVGRYWMEKKVGGSIVFVSSRGAHRGEPLAAAYGASKAGLNSLTGSLAQAFGKHKIRVSAVAPGFINTAMAASVLAGPRGNGIREDSPWNRVGEPGEVAESVFFLASESGTWNTGCVLDCNGASYLH